MRLSCRSQPPGFRIAHGLPTAPNRFCPGYQETVHRMQMQIFSATKPDLGAVHRVHRPYYCYCYLIREKNKEERHAFCLLLFRT